MRQERVVVVGGGHNGLVAAILAARAGAQVTLLEAADHVGGATQGAAVFAGHPARLSRYSYLVSLFPDELLARLGIELSLRSRPVSSYTPTGAGGLLIERTPGSATADSFRTLTGSDHEFAAWQRFYAQTSTLAGVIAPTLTGPLRSFESVRAHAEQAGAGDLFHALTGEPLGHIVADRFSCDVVRGVVATDGLIGTHTSLFDPSLLANRCFLYHVVGRGTGEWLVPVGGMGALTDALVGRARQLGVQLVTQAQVVVADEDTQVVLQTDDGREWVADDVLAAVAPVTVQRWLGREAQSPVGAQLKINMLLKRLPRLAGGVDPKIAFAGTTHLEEGFEQLEQAYRSSVAGEVPDPLPAEVYCHSLTDDSILNGEPGATLTLFGLHTPQALLDAHRDQAVAAALAALQEHLAEPLADCLATDAQGRPCLDIATPTDLEQTLHMPGGHIFHGDLTWPWLEEPAESVPAQYGVEVPGSRRILLAGAGTRRGGGVSGLGGAAAVDALLAQGR